MSETAHKEQAIRQVILDGAAGDYVDIADRVKERFRIDVSVALVEQVAIAMRNEKQQSVEPESVNLRGGEIGLTASHVPSEQPATEQPVTEKAPSAAVSSTPGSQREMTLQFVEAVGGFNAAHKALDELEGSLKKLM